MAIARKPLLFLIVLTFVCSTSAFADESSLEDTVRQLQKRIEALEKKVTDQDKYITTQNTSIQAQQQKIADYESKFSQFEEKFKRVPGTTTQLMEGLELGAGGTFIVQGTNNRNYAPAGESVKKSRTDGSYSADITLGKEFKEVGGRAFLHLEAGQGSGLEDDLTLYSNVNRDAGDSEARVEVTELWYEQSLFKDRVALTFGKLDPTVYFDQNEVK